MKFVAFLLLSSLTVALVLAFPDNYNAIADLPAANQHADAVSSTGSTVGAASSSSTDQLRQPRHLLKKLFHPQVVLQPILIQPQPYYSNRNPYYGTGRGYSYKRW